MSEKRDGRLIMRPERVVHEEMFCDEGGGFVEGRSGLGVVERVVTLAVGGHCPMVGQYGKQPEYGNKYLA